MTFYVAAPGRANADELEYALALKMMISSESTRHFGTQHVDKCRVRMSDGMIISSLNNIDAVENAAHRNILITA